MTKPDRAAVALLGVLAPEAMDGRTETRTRLNARPVAWEPARVVLQVLPSAA